MLPQLPDVVVHRFPKVIQICQSMNIDVRHVTTRLKPWYETSKTFLIARGATGLS
jgi:hypothetical protein